LIVVILAGMEITGLGWCGTRTGRGSELALFYEHVLGLRLVHAEADFWVFELPDGRHVEIFGSSYPGRDHFATGPVVGFAVRDLAAAVDELIRAGVELLGEPGPAWQHFRGPDGNVSNSSPAKRPSAQSMSAHSGRSGRSQRQRSWISMRPRRIMRMTQPRSEDAGRPGECARSCRYGGNLVEVATSYTAPVKAVMRVPNTRPGWPSFYIEPGQDGEELFTAREPFAFA
jgi:catechol 2,3-dioxygenase-like lactoylglutathione lyase family enzyme